MPDDDGAQITCHVCQPPEVVGPGILDHLRLFHPEEYGDGPECWPDGGFVITPEPGSFGPEDITGSTEGRER